jgi:hypothetical protein
MAHTYCDEALAAAEYQKAAAYKERKANGIAYLLVIHGVNEIPESIKAEYKKAYDDCEAAWNRFQAIVHDGEEVSA